MNVLVVGSGGREHAICWKAAQSKHLSRLYIAPGNAGTAQLGKNVSIAAEDTRRLVAFARTKAIELVIIGPEAPLAAGLVDELHTAGIKAFGPVKAAAQIEASKAFAKDFMAAHSIPTASFAIFTDYEQALAHLRQVEYPLVIKASGLAAGKGVIIPEKREEAETVLHSMLVERKFGPAGQTVIIEERMSGEEVSLMAFTDGKSLQPMPPAQDHKRLLDNDQGPNTGGMGAYAPAPVCPPALVENILQTILQPTLDGLRAEGRAFIGVLYAGLILTPHGPRVLEFNCRFGDPETEVVLPLLESDLLEIMRACVENNLGALEVRWKPKASSCVVMAAQGYPGKYLSGKSIQGLDNVLPETMIFHAGTRHIDKAVSTAGGRVLSVTGWGDTLKEALDRTYERVEMISFEGAQYRTDIGRKGLARLSTVEPQAPKPTTYASAGVSIDAGNRAVELISGAVRSTYGPEVLWGLGAFGGMYDASAIQVMRHPVLVASTDGVGTKVKLASQVGRYESIGHDLVNHCINDILVQGARPLFFMDYFAASKLSAEMVAEVVNGMAAACREAGCALLGGETAEMPGVYAPDEFDVAGTIVGAVEWDNMLPRQDLQPGDELIGLASSGAHTNGYSLIRKIFADTPLDAIFPELGVPLSQALLAPHRSYLKPVLQLLQEFGDEIKALAHLTGGSFIENIPRILPKGVSAQVRGNSWEIPPLFRLIQERGQVSPLEMYRVFNMGIGMVLVVEANSALKVQQALDEPSWVIGELVAGERRVMLV